MFFNHVYQSLTVVYVPLPYSVTSYDNELILFATLECTNVRLAGDHLLVVP